MQPAKHSRDHKPAWVEGGPGADPLDWLEASAAGESYWISVTGGVELSLGVEESVNWYQLYQSAGSEAFFDYEVEVGGGEFGDDIAHPRMKQSGVYTFSLSVLTSDFSTAHPGLRFQTRTQICDNSSDGVNVVYPGGIGTEQYYQAIWPFYVSDSGGDDLWIPTSWTVPVKHPAEGTAKRTGKTRILYSSTIASTVFFDVRLWIIRHGGVNWTPSSFADSTQTWP